jgi:hypothetical protein
MKVQTLRDVVRAIVQAGLSLEPVHVEGILGKVIFQLL